MHLHASLSSLLRAGKLCALAVVTAGALFACSSGKTTNDYTRLSGEVFTTTFSIQYDLPTDYSLVVD